MSDRLTKADYAHFVAQGISYDSYMQQFTDMVHKIKNDEPVNYPHIEYLPINLQRMQRVEKTLVLNDDVTEALKYLTHETTWLILTEFWCGDAAQNIPVFQKIAEASDGKVNVSLLFRDKNEALMNHYLTDGSKSIPKLIQIDPHFNVTGYWGPRPTPAQNIVKEYLKDHTRPAHGYNEDVQRWYANDKSLTIQKEALKLLKLASAMCPDCMI